MQTGFMPSPLIQHKLTQDEARQIAQAAIASGNLKMPVPGAGPSLYHIAKVGEKKYLSSPKQRATALARYRKNKVKSAAPE